MTDGLQTLRRLKKTHKKTPVKYRKYSVNAILLFFSAYHFGIEVFNVLRVENSHEGLGVHSLAGVFLSHHESHILRIVLKVIYEGLAFASYGLSGKDTPYISLLSKCDTHFKMKIAQVKHAIFLPLMKPSAAGWHWSHICCGSCWQAAGSPAPRRNATLSCRARIPSKPGCRNRASRH